MSVAGLQQLVLNAMLPVGSTGRRKSLWLDELIFPFYVATASSVVLLIHKIWTSKLVKTLRGVNEQDSDVGTTTAAGFFAQRGGVAIFFFKAVRLGGVIAVLGLSAFAAIAGKLLDLALVATLGYASVLAVLNVAARAKSGLLYSRHLSLVAFATLAVYAYRNVWPLMTIPLRPKDEAEGNILWVKIALLALVGMVLPLFEPYPYIPYDPEHPMVVPNPEQTASLASFLTFVWLDPVIFRAYRVKHLQHEELPPLCDYDEVDNLIKLSYPSLDPFSGASNKRNLFWGIAKIFRRSLIYQSILLVLFACGMIAVPIGTNRLLTYLQTGGEGAFVKPWVWILWIGGGPILQSLCFQFYIFLSTGSLARVESIFTALIFDHALRIRLKAETSTKKDDAPSGVLTPPAVEGTSPPDNASTEGGEDDSETAHSRNTTTTTATTDTTAVAHTSAPTSNGKDVKKKDGDKKQEATAADDKKGKNLAGKLNNLVTSDLGNITDGRDFLFVVLSAPLMSAMAMWFLYDVLGWSAFVGLATMIIMIPVPTWVATKMSGVQKIKMKSTDARVQSVTEVMSVLRMVKLFGWEPRVAETVKEKRELELEWVWKGKVLRMVNSAINTIIPLLHMVVTYGVYTTVMKKQLTAAIVFSSFTAFETIESQIFRVMFFVPHLITANVSLGRIAEFLRNTELLDAFTETAPQSVLVDASWQHTDDLGFARADFAWSREDSDGTLTPSRRAFRLQITDAVHFKRGAVNLVIGPTGAGKTSVLMALLGEMHYVPRDAGAWVSLPRAGGVAYAAQESWVQNETIKDNILFGSPYDEERYKKVIYQCGLTRDLTLFDAGDATEVGEKGITLSGGQKARITLARAVYSSAEILLLDDVLAALDVHTSRWIVNKCFKGDLIRGRTVILVTHNVAIVSPIADFAISLRDGHIISQGSVSDALKKDQLLSEEFKHEEEALDLEESEEAVANEEPADSVEAPAKAGEGKLVVAEEVAVGHVSWAAFKLFFDGMAGKWPFLFWFQYLGGSTAAELFSVLEMWWLGFWAKQYALRDAGDVQVSFYLGMYCVVVLLAILCSVYCTLVYTFGTLRASRTIHEKLVKSLLGSTFRWLDVTPTSRVIARCTQDIQAVDAGLANDLNFLIGSTFILIVRLGAVVIFTPIFLLPALCLAGVGGFLGNVYIRSQLSIKREMSTAKAPVLGAFGGAMAGLTSIRAYSAQNAFRQTLHSRVDRYMRASRSFYNVNRWIGIRLDTLGQIFTASLAFYLVYGGVVDNPSNVGFIISMAVSFSNQILWWVRIYNEFEVKGNSLERIEQYLEIDHEPEPKSGGVPPAYWPASGDLRVEKLSARYSEDGPKVLQDVSFHAQAGERVGIVGRTGSGKSTLTLALLRCIYAEGSVLYDGLPTSTINLDALRSNITIIPQVPELLSGTLRHNLDMFAQYDDATLNDGLRAAGLFSLQSASDDNRLTLDSEIASGGGNLSVGQRQVIALARAIVRQSKLLILDEATSAIDYETDTVIQSSLRTELKNDVTVITVAHRLQTIMDYDKIMVLDAGRLVEFDTPKALLQKEDSLLRALVDESADKDALYAMAEGKA